MNTNCDPNYKRLQILSLLDSLANGHKPLCPKRLSLDLWNHFFFPIQNTHGNYYWYCHLNKPDISEKIRAFVVLIYESGSYWRLRFPSQHRVFWNSRTKLILPGRFSTILYWIYGHLLINLKCINSVFENASIRQKCWNQIDFRKLKD